MPFITLPRAKCIVKAISDIKVVGHALVFYRYVPVPYYQPFLKPPTALAHVIPLANIKDIKVECDNKNLYSQYYNSYATRFEFANEKDVQLVWPYSYHRNKELFNWKHDTEKQIEYMTELIANTNHLS